MSSIRIPNFGELLAPYLSDVPPEALPYLLSQLERTAAARYRSWAEALPDHAPGILECAAREDDIADRAEALFAPSDEHRALVAGIMPAAKDTYYAVFDGHTPIEQMTIQENAERQGSGAWQNLKAAHPDKADALDALSAIELESAGYLKALLKKLGG
jgi:hypothetical protein